MPIVAQADSAASPEYWNAFHEANEFAFSPEEIPFRDVFDRYFPRGGSCFEVGCHPGSFLIYLGQRFGYTVSGIDLASLVETRVPASLAFHNVPYSVIKHGDFFSMPSTTKYDVVCSFGFIEHFSNYREVLARQISLLKPGGTLFVSCPNFRGLQRILHRWLDPDNLSRHVLDAMNLNAWKEVCEQNDVTVLESGYYGTFGFWTEDPIRYTFNRLAKRVLVKGARLLDGRIDHPTWWLSPFMYCVGRRV